MNDSVQKISDSTPPPRSQVIRWKRRKWIIDRKLQYSMIACSALFALAVVVLFYGLSARASNQLVKHAMGLPMRDREHLITLVEEISRAVRMSILIGFAGISTLFSYFMLSLSNRIAGPLFNLKRAMRKSRESGELQRVKFRKNDLLPDLADEYNRLIDHLGVEKPGPDQPL